MADKLIVDACPGALDQRGDGFRSGGRTDTYRRVVVCAGPLPGG